LNKFFFEISENRSKLKKNSISIQSFSTCISFKSIDQDFYD
jgi:hypothetical protein